MKPFVIRHSCFVICLCLFLLTGCGSPPAGEARWWAPSTWGKGSEGKAVAKALKAEENAAAPLLESARGLAHETTLALASAPASRPVEVATHSATQAATLLDQLAGPLTAAQAADLRGRIAALLSDSAATRDQAEKDRATRDAALARLSATYATTQAALDKAQGDLTTAFAREHAAANEARLFRARLWWIGGGLGLLWLASQLLPLLAHSFPATAPIASVANLLQPGTAYVSHRLRSGLQRIGHAIAEMPSHARAEVLPALDANTDADHQRIIRTARETAAAP